MIDAKQLGEVLSAYDLSKLTIGVLGGHSALDICRGAKKHGFRTLVVAQKRREKTYEQYYRSRGGGVFGGDSGGLSGGVQNGGQGFSHGTGCVDEVLVLDSFADITRSDVQERLRALNVIFIHNRYFWVYCDFEKIENEFLVPIFGTRSAVKLEERNVPGNQYSLLSKAGISMPRLFASPREIDRLAIVKVNEALRKYERAFFIVSSYEEYEREGRLRVERGEISADDLERAVIEEYILGAQVNVNFFQSVMRRDGGGGGGDSMGERGVRDVRYVTRSGVDGRGGRSGDTDRHVGARSGLELMGTDIRRQTNLDGILRLPSWEQAAIPAAYQKALRIETGHVAVTVKESLLEKFFDAGERFMSVCRERFGGNDGGRGGGDGDDRRGNPNSDRYISNSPGLIGPFALQGAIACESGREEFVVFDVSMRIPGSPGTVFTPYSGYLWGDSMSYGERIALEIREAVTAGRVSEIVT